VRTHTGAVHEGTVLGRGRMTSLAGGGAKEGYLGIGAMPVTVAGPQLRLGWIDT
jgi:hypothetical protein